MQKILKIIIFVIILSAFFLTIWYYFDSKNKILYNEKINMNTSENYNFVSDYIDFLITIDSTPYRESKLASYQNNSQGLSEDLEKSISVLENAKGYLEKWGNTNDQSKREIIDKGIKGVLDNIKMYQIWTDAIFRTDQESEQEKLFGQADSISGKMKEEIIRSGTLFAASNLSLTIEERLSLRQKLNQHFKSGIDEQKEYEKNNTKDYTLETAVWPAIFLDTWLLDDKYHK